MRKPTVEKFVKEIKRMGCGEIDDSIDLFNELPDTLPVSYKELEKISLGLYKAGGYSMGSDFDCVPQAIFRFSPENMLSST
jgi:hypothetical protein